jgi:hypothetical protein
MIKPKIGLTLIISSICVWVIDRSTRVMSDLFGELFCGAAYLQPVNGVVGDGSCGFNTDMYLAACLFFILLLVGSALLVGPKIIGIKRPSKQRISSHRIAMPRPFAGLSQSHRAADGLVKFIRPNRLVARAGIWSKDADVVYFHFGALKGAIDG